MKTYIQIIRWANRCAFLWLTALLLYLILSSIGESGAIAESQLGMPGAMGTVLVATAHFLLSGAISVVVFLVYRQVDRRLERARQDEEEGTLPVSNHFARGASRLEKALFGLVTLLGLALCANGFGQYAAFRNPELYLKMLDAHKALGIFACAVFAVALAVAVFRRFSWKTAAAISVYPLAFIWVLIAPTPLLLTFIFVDVVFFPSGILFLVLRETPREKRAVAAAWALGLYAFMNAAYCVIATLSEGLPSQRVSFPMRELHAYLAPAALLVPIFLAFCGRMGFLAPEKGKKTLATAVALGVVCVAAGSGLYGMQKAGLEKIRESRAYPSNPLSTKTGEEFKTVEEGYLYRNGECGACHSLSHRQWSVSVHALAARNIPFQKTVKTLMDKHGPEFGLLCATCHDPEVALTGDPQRLIDPEHIARSEGVSCRGCHFMSVAEGKNGWYALAIPRSDSFDSSKDRAKYINAANLEHVGDVSKANGRDGTMCFPCHLLESKRKGEIKIPLDNVSSFLESKFSKIMPCHRCHMPRIERNELEYTIKDHRFFGIQQELPTVAVSLREGEESAAEKFSEDTGKWLRGDLAVWDVAFSVLDETINSYKTGNLISIARQISESAKVNTSGNHFEMALEKSDFRDGEADLTFSVLNKNISHNFPSNLFANITEIWLELSVIDTAGREVFFAGWDPDKLHRRLGRVEVDEGGHPIFPDESLEYVDIVNEKFIQPEKKHFETYTIKLDDSIQFPLKATHRLMYRRYSDEYMEWITDGKIKSVPERALIEREFVIEKPDGA